MLVMFSRYTDEHLYQYIRILKLFLKYQH